MAGDARTADAPAAVETHCATVVLLGDRAYKVKKPLDLGFVDWRTLQSRRDACQREVELNRRFAPDVYLGVAEVLSADGEPCESIVVMQRMPAGRRLSTLVTSGVEVRDVVRQLARELAAHHAVARRSGRIDAAGHPSALRQRWIDNVAVLQQSPHVVDGETVEEVTQRALGYVEGRTHLLLARIASGLVRDGHGDLLADDIFCLDDGPRILDCLEFDDDLRAVDGVDDAACLAMDLERLGAPELGSAFLSWFVEFSGHPCPPSLIHHYIAYRAVMRAKVMTLKSEQGDRSAAAVAQQLLAIGLHHLRRGQPRLVLVGGPPGSGKSTVAGGLADTIGAVLIGSDRLRKEMAGLDPSAHAASSWRTGLYSAERTAAVYSEMARRAGELLGAGESVVLDATWSAAASRELARGAAARASASVCELVCVAPEAVSRQRVLDRGNSHSSDVSSAISAQLRAAFEPWPQACPISTSGDFESALRAAQGAVFADP